MQKRKERKTEAEELLDSIMEGTEAESRKLLDKIVSKKIDEYTSKKAKGKKTAKSDKN